MDEKFIKWYTMARDEWMKETGGTDCDFERYLGIEDPELALFAERFIDDLKMRS